MRILILATLSVFTLLAAGADITVNIKDFGALGNSLAKETKAIQSAIDDCARRGGGSVVIPPGVYLCGAIRLTNSITLDLKKGAILLVCTNKEDFPSSRHFIYAENCQNIHIKGEGIINGQATADYGSRWGVPQKPPFRTGILLFKNCKDISTRGITILNSDAWTLHFQRCENVVVENITIRNNYKRLNSDGIDPNSCKNVQISHCNISAGDDCIVLKSTEPYPCENVVVRDCVLESAASALKIGTESFGDFRNITFINCVISNSPTGIGFYLKDGATIENVAFSNIVIGLCGASNRTVTPVFMDIERRHADSKVGKIRNVRFEKLNITTGSGILIQGMPESYIEKLTFKDINIKVPIADNYSRRSKPIGGNRTTRDERDTLFARLPSYFTIAYTKDLIVENLNVEIEKTAFDKFQRSAFCARFIENCKIINLKYPQFYDSVKTSAVDIKDCSNLTILKN